jgi:hypothetical protein
MFRPGAQDPRRGQERQQLLPYSDWSGAGAAAAVRSRERLVDVDVHYVESGLTGLEAAHDGVQVGPVHVGQTTGFVDRVEQFAQPRLEQPERRRVRDHDRRSPRPKRGPERFHVDAAVRRRRDSHRREAGHRRGGRVGAVGRVRNQDFRPGRVAAAEVIRPDHQDARQLALRARPPAEA